MSGNNSNDALSSSPTKDNLASHYALHVALQTMKERCLALQQRLTTVEDENSELRLKYGTDTPITENNPTNNMDRSELELLREQIGELTRQKLQLTEHIGMVASENRQLWSRLSKLTKDNQSLGMSLNKIKETLTSSMAAGHQNLIRSKTFTQNSPNMMLRQKLPNADVAQSADELSLEEIPLKEYPNQNYDNPIGVNNSLGFGYLNDESINTILQNDTKKCLEKMLEIKKELLRQQSDLKVALSGLRQRKEICTNCKNRSKKASTADKHLGTSDDERELFPLTAKFDRSNDNSAFAPIQPDNSANRMDILQQKRIADNLDKMCPMCGEIYTSTTSFEFFRDHVESHFIDDSELDMSVEKHYEFVSNTVGNF